jgi:pimeloyl-ACP methyl ester carboxylesterase
MVAKFEMTNQEVAIQSRKGIAQNGNVRLAYEAFGPASGEPLLLIMGVGMQMLLWRDDFCHELVKRGFQVARMDNRDVGHSTHLHQDGEPSVVRMIIQPKRVATYSLQDMAADSVAVLDALGWKSAHIVGGSMGGMIAQTMAIHFSERMRTLTSIMAPPSPRIGRGPLRTALKLAKIMKRPLRSAQEAGEQMVAIYQLIGTPQANYPLDEAWLREVGASSYERAYDSGGRLRQQAAFLAAGDLRQDLSHVRVPTLVMHGDADPLIRLEAGRATAMAIPGAQLVVLRGVGHGAFPRAVWPMIIDHICALRDRWEMIVE